MHDSEDSNESAHEDLVLIFDAPDQTTAEVVCATLQAAGIHAILQNENQGPASGMLPYMGLADARGVLVAREDAEAATALLQAQEPTEEELTAEVDADPTSLEEAEARVK
jgi:Putative prokaryotic signal transducing protein